MLSPLRSETGCAALTLAARGIYVFPVPPGTKRSYVPWGTEASIDTLTIVDWWSRWPGASVGVACRLSGLVVVDLDGPAGMESWARLTAEHGPVFTCAVSTGRDNGGTHLWFQAGDARVPNSSGLLGPGVDVRGNVNRDGDGHGGMVIAPPSRHRSGRRYQWSGGSLATLPEWLATLSTPQKPVRLALPARTGVGTSPDRLLGSLVQVVMDATPDTDRNNRLFWAACRGAEHVAAGRLAEQVVVDALIGAAEAKGLPAGEAARTIRSALGRAVRA
nr:bifunctional DNA primase/polymerase [Frankia sp. CcI49]